MSSAKDFAVVYFDKEDTYSEIPVSWLTSDKKQCWWPTCLNPRSRMVRGDIPDSDDTTWVLHDIKIETYASTLESARKKAEEPDYATGNESLIVGPRPRKPTKKYDDDSSSCSESLTPPPSPKDPLKLKYKKKVARITLQRIKSKINEGSPESVVTSAAVDSQTEDRNEKSNCFKSSTSETVGPQINSEDNNYAKDLVVVAGENVMDLQEKPEIPVIICKEDATVADLHFELQKVQMTCDAMYKYLVSIDQRLKAFTLEKGNEELNAHWEALMSKLPLKTKEDITSFDQVLIENEELKKKFIHFIKRIGGKDVRDNVNRVLSYLFTNKLGTQCSFIGFRGNFKLQGFNFMNLFIDIIVLQQKCTKHEVEKSIGEWFRLSNQRGKREKTALVEALV